MMSVNGGQHGAAKLLRQSIRLGVLLDDAQAHMKNLESIILQLTVGRSLLKRMVTTLTQRTTAAKLEISRLDGALSTAHLRLSRERAASAAKSDEIKTNTMWNPQCVVCLDTGVTHAIVHGDTGHMVFCTGCAGKEGRDDVCAVCRSVGKVVRIFQPGTRQLQTMV